MPTPRFLIALLAALLGAPATALERPATVDLDRIVVVVNDEVITATELERRVAETRRQLAAARIAAPSTEVLARQVLEQLIVERIQLQLAARHGIRVTDSEIERALESVARQNGVGVAAFQEMLAREGIDRTDYRAQLRDQITVRHLVEREVNQRVVVTESEVTSFLEHQEGRANVDIEYDLSHIFVTVPEAASAEAIEAARSRAERARARLTAGEAFEQVAIAFSQAPDALGGGALGWRRAGQLPELFLDALRRLAPGAISPILRSPNGFHIVRLNDQRGGAVVEPVTQTHVRHILLRPSEILSAAEARHKLEQLRARVEQGDDFATLARAHSEDTASAANGGDLGWVSPGQLVPEFERAMKALAPGALSAPVRSPFGWHLLQVLARRTQDVTEERLRAAARAQIHARKADERFQQWIRELRDEAYVEHRTEDVN